MNIGGRGPSVICKQRRTSSWPDADVSRFGRVNMYTPVVDRNARPREVGRHQRKIGRHLDSIHTIRGRKVHAVAGGMGMDLPQKPEAVLYRDVGDVVQQAPNGY